VLFKEALDKSILDFSGHAAAQTWFAPCFKINNLRLSILVAEPFAASGSSLCHGNADLISVSLMAK
jgi:hypothetical protein